MNAEPYQSTRSEYIPDDSEASHKKPFKLAPYQTPDEEARDEVLRVVAPKIRRQVREDERLSAGAKYFFFCLFDDCFWHKAGGYGTGQIYADIKTLALRYLHGEKTIRTWRDELVSAGWLYTCYSWPYTEWRLTPLMPAPSDNRHKRAVQMALGRAAKSTDTPPTAQNGHNAGNSTAANGRNGHRERSTSTSPVVEMTAGSGKEVPEVAVKVTTSDGHFYREQGQNLPRATGDSTTSNGKAYREQGESIPQPPSFGPSGAAQNQSQEKVSGSLEPGDIGGVMDAPRDPAFEKWIKSLNGRFPSHLEKLRTKFKSQLNQARGNVRDCLKLKIAKLDELLDGPLPAWDAAKPAEKPSIISKIAQRPPSPEELAAHAEFMAQRKAKGAK